MFRESCAALGSAILLLAALFPFYLRVCLLLALPPHSRFSALPRFAVSELSECTFPGEAGSSCVGAVSWTPTSLRGQ